MKLRAVIERLEKLSENHRNDNLEVVFRLGNSWMEYPSIEHTFLCQEPDYNQEESNCGPYEWVELDIDREDREFFGLDN